MIIKLAWRNIWRNKRRTILTALTLTIGVVALSMMLTLAAGMVERMIRVATHSRIGDAQIHAAHYLETQDETLTIPSTTALLEQARKLPDVKDATARSIGIGVLSIADRTSGIQLLGIDPEHEKNITNWSERIVDGEYISEPGQVMMGSHLAEKLEVEVGSKMILTAANVTTGETTAELVRVKGLLYTGDVATDRQAAIVHLDMAQKMMGTRGQAHEIVLKLNIPIEQREPIEAIIAPLKRDGISVEPWQTMNPIVAQMKGLMESYMDVMVVVLFMILAFGLINTISMSLLERMREFGVMRSLGTSGSMLAKLIVTEAAFLGFIGAVPGIVCGLLISQLLVTYGLDFAGTTAYGMEFREPIYGQLDIPGTVRVAVMFVILTTLVSLFTAIRAARLEPVEAMRGG